MRKFLGILKRLNSSFLILDYDWAKQLYYKAKAFEFKFIFDIPQEGYTRHIHLVGKNGKLAGIHIQVAKKTWEYLKNFLDRRRTFVKCDIVALKKGYRGIARTLESYIEDSQLLLDERVLYRLIEFYRKLVSYNIPCEMIAYSLEPLEDCYGYALELLGLDVVCDMAESLIVM